MTQQVVAGNDLTLQATFYSEDDGVLVNPTGLTLNVYKGATLYAGPFTTPDITNPTTGLFVYTLSIGSDAEAGAYSAMWAGTYNSNTLTGVEAFEVLASSADKWVSAVEASSITGITVTDSQVAQAQAIVQIETGVNVVAKANLGAGDLEWMKQAVAWQAAWVKDQYDLASRQSVTNINQDGLSATYDNVNAVYLAPLAAKAIRQLSWMRTRTVGPRVRPRNYWDRVAESDEGWEVFQP